MSKFLVVRHCFEFTVTNNRFEHTEAPGWLYQSRCHLEMTNDTGISSRKSNEEYEKLNFHSLSGEGHKNRIKANEFEFMRLRYTSCQIASGVDLSTWRFITPSLPRSITVRRENWFPVLLYFTSTGNNVERDGGRKESTTRHGPMDLLLHALWARTMNTCFARDQPHAPACASCLQKREKKNSFPEELTKSKTMTIRVKGSQLRSLLQFDNVRWR